MIIPIPPILDDSYKFFEQELTSTSLVLQKLFTQRKKYEE
jgi:hypothetical protein